METCQIYPWKVISSRRQILGCVGPEAKGTLSVVELLCLSYRNNCRVYRSVFVKGMLCPLGVRFSCNDLAVPQVEGQIDGMHVSRLQSMITNGAALLNYNCLRVNLTN
jgi:hypothetical protein